jgi:3-oxo-5-alpha-steroid 4-dehydrogenase 1
MQEIFNPEVFNTVLSVMALSAVVVFLCLLKVEAGYGVAYTKKWGPAVNNKLGWILMEAPVFFAMLWLWLSSDRRGDTVLVVMTLLFLFHYFQRSFVFPFLIKGKSVMPLSVILMGVTFNTLNAYMIGGWLFYVSPVDYYGGVSWLMSPMFIVGCVIFFVGMAINWHSDYIIRHLRKPGDTGHYIPRGGMFRYVTSANYFGEFLEWCGFALLTFSAAGAVFALWTFANLAPRARKLHQRYEREFGDEYKKLNRKYILPYIY